MKQQHETCYRPIASTQKKHTINFSQLKATQEADNGDL